MRIKLTQTTVKYFIITKVAYSDPNTTITIYGGTDYDLANAAITSPYYSLAKAPIGFPLDPTKWTVEVTDNTDATQVNPAAGTWYNLGSITITIPIGVWRVFYKASGQSDRAVAGNNEFRSTLSTANNSESDSGFTCSVFGNDSIAIVHHVFIEKILNLSSKATYYLNALTNQAATANIIFRGSGASLTIIKAVCAYL